MLPQKKEAQRFRKAHVAADGAAADPYIAATGKFFVTCTPCAQLCMVRFLQHLPLQKLQDKLETRFAGLDLHIRWLHPPLVAL